MKTLYSFGDEALGTALKALASAAPTSAVWPVVNRAIAIPFQLDQKAYAVWGFVFNGSIVSGNVDVGIYRYDLRLLGATTASAQSGTNEIQTQRFAGGGLLLPIGTYYMALSASLATARMFAVALNLNHLRALGVVQMAAAHPLPAQFNPAAVTNAYLPCFGIGLETVI